jgi:early secretory antigenic target protein ESAT-6
MDGDQVKYSFAAIDGLAGDISTRVKNIEGVLSDLGAQINKLQSIWVGSANEGFVKTKTDWFNASEDLTRVLNNIQIAVTQTNQDAQHTESQNTARWNG